MTPDQLPADFNVSAFLDDLRQRDGSEQEPLEASDTLCIHCHIDEATVEGLVCEECYVRAMARNAMTTASVGARFS